MPEHTAEDNHGFATKAIHAGQQPDPTTGAIIQPISLSTTFHQHGPGELYGAGYDYSRSGNPTREAFEKNVAACEGAKHGLAFASGSAATATVINMLSAGDHVVTIDDVYGGTQRYFNKVATRLGITFTFADLSKKGELENAIQPNTKLIWMESPTNPTLKLADIRAVTDRAHQNDILVLVDNTFMSPYFQNPLKHGADLVLHSVSKYINGHTDVIGGIVLTSSDKLHEELKFLQNSVGSIPSPFDCFLALRGMKTLAVRMDRHQANARIIAQFLEGHVNVDKVRWLGLESHPQHHLAKKQMSGFGGMITFFVKGGMYEAKQFLGNVRLARLAESLGAVETLIEHPASMTHASVPAAMREKLGISDSLIRVSVGIEDIKDLVSDFGQALDNISVGVFAP